MENLVATLGTLFMLILLPFTFLQFFWTPWIEAQNAARIPRRLQAGVTDHVIITQHDSLPRSLIERLKQFHYRYVLVIPDLDEAVRLQDEGLSVIAGDLDDPDTYTRARVDEAALVATTCSDQVNTTVAVTVRSVDEDVAIVAIADTPASVDILELAGCTRVLQLAEMLGESLARRISGGDALAHVLGEFDELLIAEATATRTPLVGKSLAEAGLRRMTGTSVIGVWERGRFESARPETVIDGQSVERTAMALAPIIAEQGKRHRVAAARKGDAKRRAGRHPGALHQIIEFAGAEWLRIVRLRPAIGRAGANHSRRCSALASAASQSGAGGRENRLSACRTWYRHRFSYPCATGTCRD